MRLEGRLEVVLLCPFCIIRSFVSRQVQSHEALQGTPDVLFGR